MSSERGVWFQKKFFYKYEYRISPRFTWIPLDFYDPKIYNETIQHPNMSKTQSVCEWGAEQLQTEKR